MPIDTRQSNSLSIIGFVLSLVGVIMCIIIADIALLLGISAVILASIALVKAGKCEKKGRGFAKAGYFFYVYYVPHLINMLVINLSNPLP
jgi:hypothetical protein